VAGAQVYLSLGAQTFSCTVPRVAIGES